MDPVGACVGMKGTRVQAIIRELRGEKIDIVEWSEDPISVRDERPQPGQGAARLDRRRREPGDGGGGRGQQLSLAIGKKGQNVRLAAKLTGWRIDIKSEEEKRKEVEAQLGALEAGDGEATAAAAERRPTRRTEVAAVAEADAPASTEGPDTARGRCGRQRLNRRTQIGHGPYLQSRRTARHDEPGSAGAPEEGARHRAEERVEHARRSGGALVRRAHGAAAPDHAAVGRPVRRPSRTARRAARRRRAGRRRPSRPSPRPGAGPPRLVKSPKVAPLPGAEPASGRRAAPAAEVTPDVAAATAVAPAAAAAPPEPVARARTRGGRRRNRPSRCVEEPAAPPRRSRRGAAATSPLPPLAAGPAAAPQPPAGRFVPPTLRLRIEEPGRTPQPARPTTPAKRPPVTQPRLVQAPPATPPPAVRASRRGRRVADVASGHAAGARPGYPVGAGRRRAACSAVRARCRRSRCGPASPACRRVRACPASGRRSGQRPGVPFGQRPMGAPGHEPPRAAVGPPRRRRRRRRSPSRAPSRSPRA